MLIVLAMSKRLTAVADESASRMEETDRLTVATWIETAVSLADRSEDVMTTA
jgi:hypothetical protein